MKNNNSLFKHFVTIGIGTFLNMLLAFITTPIITRIVSPNEYGQYSLFTTYSGIALMVLCLGMDQALVRFFYDKKDFNYKKQLLFNTIIIPFIICVIGSVVALILTLTNILTLEFSKSIMILLIIYTFVQVIYRFSQLVNRLEFNTKLYSLLNVFIKLFYIIIAIPLLLVFKNDYLFILTISITASTILCLFISIYANRELWIFKGKMFFPKDKMYVLIKYSYPYIFSMGITTLFQAIDKLSLNYFTTYDDVGIYSSAIMIVNVFAIVQTAFNTVWAPSAFKHYSEEPNDTSFYIKGNQIITLIMFLIGINIILFKDVLVLFLGSKYRDATYIIPFLIFNPIMYTISETTVNGINFKKKTKLHIVIAIAACITNIIGNFILIPNLGSKGASISTGISYIVFFSLRTILSNKYYYVDFKLNKFYIVTIFVSIFALYNTFYHFNLISLFIYLIINLLLIVFYKKYYLSIFKYLKSKRKT